MLTVVRFIVKEKPPFQDVNSNMIEPMETPYMKVVLEVLFTHLNQSLLRIPSLKTVMQIMLEERYTLKVKLR